MIQIPNYSFLIYWLLEFGTYLQPVILIDFKIPHSHPLREIWLWG